MVLSLAVTRREGDLDSVGRQCRGAGEADVPAPAVGEGTTVTQLESMPLPYGSLRRQGRPPSVAAGHRDLACVYWAVLILWCNRRGVEQSGSSSGS